jgi:hypothetical protein
MDKFETVIDGFVVDTKEKMLTVARESINDVIRDAQVPVSKGGKMRVKTGFLRSTGLASLNAPVRGPSRGDKTKTYAWDGTLHELVLGKMQIGDYFYFGWTANYAQVRETYDGFLISALDRWKEYVNRSVARYKK